MYPAPLLIGKKKAWFRKLPSPRDGPKRSIELFLIASRIHLVNKRLPGRSLLYVDTGFEVPVLATKQLFFRLDFQRNEELEAAIS